MVNPLVDKLVMLLSTDWFLPYWFVLGIDAQDERRKCVQVGCREIVKQIISGTQEYWLTDFSPERVRKTTETFQSLLQKCRADSMSIGRVRKLTEGSVGPMLEDRVAWLLQSITRRLVDDSLREYAPLAQSIKERVKQIFENSQPTDSLIINFEELCLSSKSTWDTFVREVTPGLPTYLSDYLALIRIKNTFEILWMRVNGALSENERDELLSWYNKVSEELTGEPLSLSG
jgi:hypothetical protein